VGISPRALDRRSSHSQDLLQKSRLTRTPLGTLDNDAKACYDRIMLLFALLLCQKHGVPLSACKLSAKHSSQQSMQSRRTGISKGTYSSTIDQPTHGPGQSRQASAVDGSKLSYLQPCTNSVAAYRSKKNELTHRRTSDGVDDDTHFFNMGLSTVSNNSTSDRYHPRDSGRGTGLLWTTGGNELSVLYYLLFYTFDDDGTPR
jgi:hypothetical protein